MIAVNAITKSIPTQLVRWTVSFFASSLLTCLATFVALCPAPRTRAPATRARDFERVLWAARCATSSSIGRQWTQSTDARSEGRVMRNPSHATFFQSGAPLSRVSGRALRRLPGHVRQANFPSPKCHDKAPSWLRARPFSAGTASESIISRTFSSSRKS